MAVSNWWLYIGMFLCCTGFGLIPGAIFIVYWAIRRLETVKLGNSYTENNTENNYSLNIQDYHGGNGGSGGSGPTTTTTGGGVVLTGTVPVGPIDTEVSVQADLVLDSGPSAEQAIPSTVVKVDGAKLECLREGCLPFAEVAHIFKEGLGS